MFSHPGRVHGGMICTLFDDAMSCLVACIEDTEVLLNKGYMAKTVFTLKSDVSYRKPVPAPGVILIRSKIVQIERRKRIVTATLEDEKGTVLCESGAEYLAVDRGVKAAWYTKL